jgi:hypothetical protein
LAGKGHGAGGAPVGHRFVLESASQEERVLFGQPQGLVDRAGPEEGQATQRLVGLVDDRPVEGEQPVGAELVPVGQMLGLLAGRRRMTSS